MDEQVKSLLSSKTFWGVIILLLGKFIHFEDADVTAITEHATTVVGSVLAIYGRVTANKPITL